MYRLISKFSNLNNNLCIFRVTFIQMPFKNSYYIFLLCFFFLSFDFSYRTLFSNYMPSACHLPKSKKWPRSVYFADRKIALSYEKKNAFRWLFNTAPHSPRRQKLNLRMKSLSLDSPESSELHGNMKRRYPLTGATHFNMQGGSAGLLDHNTPTSNNSRLHCKRWIIICQRVFATNFKFDFLFFFLSPFLSHCLFSICLQLRWAHRLPDVLDTIEICAPLQLNCPMKLRKVYRQPVHRHAHRPDEIWR